MENHITQLVYIYFKNLRRGKGSTLTISGTCSLQILQKSDVPFLRYEFFVNLTKFKKVHPLYSCFSLLQDGNFSMFTSDSGNVQDMTDGTETLLSYGNSSCYGNPANYNAGNASSMSKSKSMPDHYGGSFGDSSQASEYTFNKLFLSYIIIINTLFNTYLF